MGLPAEHRLVAVILWDPLRPIAQKCLSCQPHWPASREGPGRPKSRKSAYLAKWPFPPWASEGRGGRPAQSRKSAYLAKWPFPPWASKARGAWPERTPQKMVPGHIRHHGWLQMCPTSPSKVSDGKKFFGPPDPEKTPILLSGHFPLGPVREGGPASPIATLRRFPKLGPFSCCNMRMEKTESYYPHKAKVLWAHCGKQVVNYMIRFFPCSCYSTGKVPFRAQSGATIRCSPTSGYKRRWRCRRRRRQLDVSPGVGNRRTPPPQSPT